MEITVKIEAPELVGAIITLATALENGNFKLTTAALGNAANQAGANCEPAQVNPTFAQAAPTVVAAAPVNPTAAPVAPTSAPVPVAAITTAPVQAAVPTAAPSYTMEQLAVAATQLVDAGQRDNLVALLQQFGVQALNVLPKEQYGNFANALRGMGAKL